VITVLGEALIDLVPGTDPGSFVARPGGGPYNVAIGLARLGQPTALMARLADNAFGRMLRANAAAEGLDLSAAPLAAEPTTLAVVSLDANAAASYDFYLEGTADWQWTEAETAAVPPGTALFHFGSLAAWTPPGDALVLDLAARLRELGVLVSFDPNVRPALLGDPQRGRAIVERGVRLAHVVKASAEDVGWLYPDMSSAQVADKWLTLGASVVVVTDGGAGATASTREAAVHRPAPQVVVVDTVGAGDAFMSGLLAALADADAASPDRVVHADLGAVLDYAARVAAVTCTRLGADPPTRAELAVATS
jgi:fructokinase